MSGEALDIPLAILAGGLATRLRPITERIPKVLVPVAGRPFLAHQLELLKLRGIRKVVLCVGHLGQMVEEQFRDGGTYGIQLEYSYDGPVLLGTGGALRQALPKLGNEFFVLYGDSYLPIDYGAPAEAFRASGKLGLMTIFRNQNQYDTSNVWFEAGQIKVYEKKNRIPEMQHIDYGLSLFKAAAFEPFQGQQSFDLAELMKALVNRRELAGFEVTQRFYEIGSPAGLAELEDFLRRGKW